MKIHLFNPEHDIALAANSRHWTAPHAGRKLRYDLGWLPALWAEDGDVVVVDDVDRIASGWNRLKLTHKPEVKFCTLKTVAACCQNADAVEVKPWGWDISIKAQLMRAGLDETLMPTDAELDAIRMLSGRQQVPILLNNVHQSLTAKTCGEAFEATSVDEIKLLAQRYGDVVVKSPWSSSGRGVRYLNGSRTENIYLWAAKVIGEQGCIMVEPLYDKICDFAMEFQCDAECNVEYKGLSVFKTSNGAYVGNVIATETEKEQMLCKYVSPDALRQVRESVCAVMSDHLRRVSSSVYGSDARKSVYVGPFGVDMMICKGGEVHPFVELNLRHTMGHAALALTPEEESKQQVMRITYEGTAYHFRLMNDHEIYY